MNTMPIEDRLQMDIQYNNSTQQYVGTVYDSKTEEVYVQIKQWDDYWLRQKLHDAVSQFLKEWKCQDQTSNTGLKYRKTIISSCGQLTVTESPA